MSKSEKGEREMMCAVGITFCVLGIALLVLIFYRELIWPNEAEQIFFAFIITGPVMIVAGIAVFKISLEEHKHSGPFLLLRFFTALLLYLSFLSILLYGMITYSK